MRILVYALKDSGIGVSPALLVISKVHSSITVSGMQIAFSVAACIFPVNRIHTEQAST